MPAVAVIGAQWGDEGKGRMVDMLNSRGVDTSRLRISDRAHLFMPYHIALEGLEEKALGSKAIGTTLRGIGPAFADKTARNGIRAGDLLDKAVFRERLATVLEMKNRILAGVYGQPPLSFEEIYRQYCAYADRWAPFICDTSTLLAEAVAKDKNVLLEGAQGVLLDPDFGTYHFGTSSSPTAAGACQGSGIAPGRLSKVLG